MARRIESLFVAGAAGRLEAILEEPEGREAVEAAVVCHPHPRHGGTMHNKVVYRLARGLRHAGCAVLRFNFRGVNLSEGEYDHGVGEADDARRCVNEMRARYPHLPLMIAGFSFGSRVALRIAARDSSLSRAVAVGFPTVYGDQDFVRQVQIRKYFVQSTHDEHGPRPEFEPFYASVPEPKQLFWIESVDHFFKDALDPYERAIEQIGLDRETS